MYIAPSLRNPTLPYFRTWKLGNPNMGTSEDLVNGYESDDWNTQTVPIATTWRTLFNGIGNGQELTIIVTKHIMGPDAPEAGQKRRLMSSSCNVLLGTDNTFNPTSCTMISCQDSQTNYHPFLIGNIL